MLPKSLEDYPKELEAVNRDLDGMILDAPYYSFKEIAERFIKGAESLDPDNWFLSKVGGPLLKGKTGDKIIQGMQYMVKDYLKLPVDLFTIIPAKIMADSKLGQKPMVVIHGDLDFVTPYHHGVRVYETLKAKNPNQAEFVTLQGAEHLSRDWDPAKTGERNWSADRADLKDHIKGFLAKISSQPEKQQPEKQPKAS
jgi:pimeloyl-ACP methyl ester carboxylesterase